MGRVVLDALRMVVGRRVGALLVVGTLLSGVGGRASAGGATYAAEVAPGVEHQTIQDPAGPFAINVVTVSLSAASTVDAALATDELPGFETTSSIARRHSAAVAINGDYALSTGRPVHPYAEDGRMLQAPARPESAFAVNRQESLGFIDLLSTLAMSVERPGSGTGTPLHRVNWGDPDADELAGFTAEGGTLEEPPADACAARLRPDGRPRLRSDGSAEIPSVVDEARCSPERLEPGDGMTLAAPAGGSWAATVASLASGERVVARWSVGWPDVFDLMGGNPVLIHDGAVSPAVDPANPNDPFFARNPRTGVGLTQGGDLLLVTVDGRQPGYSVGMTLREFAELFGRLGAWRALNLDGGGSTTMVVNGQVVNRPSDVGGERAVASALLVLRGADPGEAAQPPGAQPAPAARVPADPGVWGLISGDAASTGGLSASLRERGVPLGPELESAADLFGRPGSD